MVNPRQYKWTEPLARQKLGLSTALSLILGASWALSPVVAQAQSFDLLSNKSKSKKNLAPDSPYQNPDITYLEADTVINDEQAGMLTASGDVEGRYQDKTLRADKVTYNLETGEVLAIGNVVIIHLDGATQYADKLKLSNELETGTGTDFFALLPGGGSMGARFVARDANDEVELYKAYYTVCEVCEDKKTPSWKLKARRVKQNKADRSIKYRDAILQLWGIPVFYTPFLSHPDPSATRASGILAPGFRLSGSKGFEFSLPYYWAIDDYTEATFTPHIYTKQNPLMEYKIVRNFHTGRINLTGSFTYDYIFDEDGKSFDDPDEFFFSTREPRNPFPAPTGKRLRSDFNLNGLFTPSDFWTYGFGAQLTTDDNYLARYNFRQTRGTNGLYTAQSRRNTSQAFLIGQDHNTRLAVSAAGFQNLYDRIFIDSLDRLRFSQSDDGTLPIIAPRIQAEQYVKDPLLNGRLKFSSDFISMTKEFGTDYMRGTGQTDYSKTWVAPGGLEVKPFANARFDYYNLTREGTDDVDFTRTLGQTGIDIRYPFLRPSSVISWTFEPRAQLTQSFGDGKLDEFAVISREGYRRGDNIGPGDFEDFYDAPIDVLLSEDAGNVDLDGALLWQSNKAAGYDFWQKGLRLDTGATLGANWGSQSAASLFVGQSYALNTKGEAVEDISGENGEYLIGSGLAGDKSDIVGEVDIKLGKFIQAQTSTRYNEDVKKFTRLESQLILKTDWIKGGVNYYKINTANPEFIGDAIVPPEEISAAVSAKLFKGWSAGYSFTRDLDQKITRRKAGNLAYNDGCTAIQFFYSKRAFNSDTIRDDTTFGVRLVLKTLGAIGTQ